MRAAVVRDQRIEIQDRPVPSPGPHEALVRVAGAGVNRADLIQRMGFYPAPPGSPPDIPGLEFSGVIEEIGTAVTHVSVGDHVFGIAGGGCQAQYVCIHELHCAIVPPSLELVAAGGVPEAFLTAHDAMVTQANIQPKDWVLIHAVGSGVGTAALQLANAFGGTAIGTARTQSKLDQCATLGLNHSILAPSLPDGSLDTAALNTAIRAIAPSGIDVTLDLVGGTYVESDIAAAAAHGRIVLIGTLAGGRCSFDILPVMQKRLTISGTVLRPRNIEQKATATAAFAADVVALLADDIVAPIVEQVIALNDAQAAYDLVATDTTFGKVILDCS